MLWRLAEKPAGSSALLRDCLLNVGLTLRRGSGKASIVCSRVSSYGSDSLYTKLLLPTTKASARAGIALHEHDLIIMPSNYPPTDGVDLRLYVMDKLTFRVTNVECHDSPMVWSGVTHIGHRYDGQPLIGAGYWLANRSEVGMNTE